jgi:hypothetical protein
MKPRPRLTPQVVPAPQVQLRLPIHDLKHASYGLCARAGNQSLTPFRRR